ncbi:MAG: head decoration protein [Rhodospirillaceae bacterium]
MTMPTQMVTEPPRLSGLIKLEEDQSYCREDVTVLAGSGADRVLTIGTILGQISNSGKVLDLQLAATDGSQNVYGLLVTNTTAPNGVDADGVALVRGPAIVADVALIYPASATAPQKAAINSAIAGLGIVIRTGV